MTRRGAEAPAPTFRNEGTSPSLRALQSQDRAGLARIAVEVDLVQRPRSGRQDLRTFARRALAALVAATASQSHNTPELPLQGLSTRGDMLTDLPAAPSERCEGCLLALGWLRRSGSPTLRVFPRRATASCE